MQKQVEYEKYKKEEKGTKDIWLMKRDKRTIPRKLQGFVKEIEGLSVKRLVIHPVNSLKGGAGGSADFLDGVPTITLAVNEDSVLAEEILHLFYRLKGYPAMLLAAPEYGFKSGEFKTMAINLIQHQVIFPRLADMGYDRRERWNKRLTANLLLIRQRQEKRLDDNWYGFMYAYLYLQANDTALKEKWSDEFDKPDLRVAKQIGLKVIDIVSHYNLQPEADYKQCVQECLEAVGINGEQEYESF